jgi:SAM-dependent methyltransferase
MNQRRVCLCGGTAFDTVFVYDAPPQGEIAFDFSARGRYSREIVRCRSCGHFLSLHEMDMSGLYSASYVDATYASGIANGFDRVVALPVGRSDNAGRVEHIKAFVEANGARREASRPPAILDVGSGLCVFLHRVKTETDWICTALDPDPRAAEHARERVGVSAVCGDFMAVPDLGRFDIITFNKVLEHVTDPVAMLQKSARHLRPGGFVYVELPDGEAASADGPGCEEFFIDHHHVFSRKSLEVLGARAGFSVLNIESLREPSGKYTLRAFLRAAGEA